MINKEPNVIIELSILMFYHYVNIKILDTNVKEMIVCIQNKDMEISCKSKGP